MADPKKPTATTPPKPPAGDDITRVGDDAPADPKVAELEKQLAEARAVAALRTAEAAASAAEVDRLKAAAGPPVFVAGKHYLVSLPDGPSWVVAVGPSEHPFECYKRATGVTGSQHTAAIHETDLPVGRVAA